MTRVSVRLLWDVVIPAIIVCLIVLFTSHALIGTTGLRALRVLEAEAALKTAEVVALEERRDRLERVADQLNPKSLDPDMVEEKIRTVLGYVAEGDIVIPRDELDALLRTPGPDAR